MKYIKTGLFLSLAFCLFHAAAQPSGTEKVPSAGDSLVFVAYRAVDAADLNGAISVLDPSGYIDKSWSNGTFFHSSMIGGNNLWGIGNALILVDGVPRNDGEITTSEVEQITYLKGANAVVLYGSRGANGVILITTKRGHVGEKRITIRGNAGIDVPKSYPEYLGSAEYMTYYNQALINDGMDIRYSTQDIYNYASGSNPYRYPDIDYFSSDYLRKMYESYSAIADFSSGTEKARFFATAGIERSNNLLKIGEGKKEGITRFNVRGNVDLKLNSFINSYTNVSAVFYDMRYAKGNYWNSAATIQPHRYAPLLPISMIDPGGESALKEVQNSNHIIGGKYILGGSQEYLTQPFADMYAGGYGTYTSRQFQFTTGLNFDLESILEGLTLNGQFSIDYSNNYTQTVDKTYAVYVPTWMDYAGEEFIGVLTKHNTDRNDGRRNLSGTYNYQLIDFNFHFDYARTFGGSHNVFAMLLAAGGRDRRTGYYQNRTYTNLGMQLSYNFEHKYYADFSAAVVSSTKLPKNNRAAISPTVSLGWALDREEFLKNSSVVDRLKLTVSAGILHTDLDLVNNNDETRSYFLYDEVYAPTAYYSWKDGGDGGYTNRATTISRSDNPKLTYAKRKEVNVGLETSMFDRMLELRATAFVIRKDGIPLQVSSIYPSFFHSYWPETSFYPFINYNANGYKGFDFQLNFKKQVNQVALEVGFSGTYMQSKVLKRDELYEDAYRYRKGNPVDAIFGLKNAGFFDNDADIAAHADQKFGTVRPGDIRYYDQNNDGLIDDRDEVKLGQWVAPFTFGLHFTAKWKNLTFFVLATGQKGGTSVKTSDYYWVYGDRKYSSLVRNSWTEATKATATYPRLTTLSGDNNFRYSDFWTYKTDQINLSNVQVTYDLPDRLFTGTGFKGLSVYAGGYNLLKISANRKIMELNIGSQPQTRFYNLGVKARF